eukprot:TRINITY_DN114098_c0_g1_i1.p1 TRINITY_DN114098_c0_g1~~TRINITY_DN114098_c0_g1_i1.p1  ORF type:complete len:135 (+),score=24.24 TRINITY_DN114098_c0_g1_i1:36-407(+)
MTGIVGAPKGEALIGIMADEDTVTGFLLAGIGDVDHRKGAQNFMVVDKTTPLVDIENNFKALANAHNIAIILISQHVADDIRYLINEHKKIIPTILEIPSKEFGYDTAKDGVLRKVKQAFGEG